LAGKRLDARTTAGRYTRLAEYAQVEHAGFLEADLLQSTVVERQVTAR
jgi:hypothetical protein